MVEISLIVAMNQDRVIGINNQLPWHITEDLQYFKKITDNKIIIMGRNTFESIGHPLKNRINIIISRNKQFQVENCKIASSIEEAISFYKDKEVFIIGGADIYSQTINIAKKLYITVIELPVCYSLKDTISFFPEINYNNWNLIESSFIVNKIGIKCIFNVYKRK